MKSKILLIISILTAFSSVAGAQTDGDYAVPRTQWDQPDLQGVWNFSSDVPMQRPQRYGTQQFLSAEEVEERRAPVCCGNYLARSPLAQVRIPLLRKLSSSFESRRP